MDNNIYMTPRVYADYKNTIARHEPETVALLGGHLDQPDLITDFKFCPPDKVRGEYQRSYSHVSVDADFMNWVIQEEWEPNDKYVRGIWHSHPRGVTTPSGRGGDLSFFEACLQSEDARIKGWDKLLAPITTFNAQGNDTVHGWTYERGHGSAKKANIFVRYQGQDYSSEEFETLCKAQDAQAVPPASAYETSKHIMEAETLARDLALGAMRLKATPGLSIMERLRASKRFNDFAKLEMTSFIKKQNNTPNTNTKGQSNERSKQQR
jgi:hypothetical protein